MITVSGLTKQYGDRTVVDDVSFTLEPGTVTGFLGPNGAGKTTTMRMITGLVPASAGSALVDGRPYAALPNPGAVDGHAARRRRGAPRPDRADAPAAAGRRRSASRPRGWTRCSSWSGSPTPADGGSAATRSACGSGSGIAGALLADPPVLMFDEPANGLDPEGIRWMRELLRGHAARGGTVLLSSHLLGEVEHTVDRLLVIGDGRIVADGPVGIAARRRRVDGARASTRPRWPRTWRPRAAVSRRRRTARWSCPAPTAQEVGAVAAAGGHVLTDLRPPSAASRTSSSSLTAA